MKNLVSRVRGSFAPSLSAARSQSCRLILHALFILSSFVFASMTPAQQPAARAPDLESPTVGDSAENADTDFAKQVQAGWPRFLGETFDGIVKTTTTFDWTTTPRVLWTLDVADGYGLGSIDSQNQYFHFDSPQGSSERLRCIDLTNGKTKWSQSADLQYRDMYGYETGPRGSATIAGDQIFTMGVGGRLSCRARTDGKLIWAVNTNEKYGVVTNFFGVGGSPLVLGDLVIVMVGGSPAEDQKISPGRLNRVSPNGSALVAFNRFDGKEAWKCGDDLASYSSPRSMVIGDETLVLLLARDHLLAVDAKTGKLRWKRRHRAEILESVNAMVPIVRDDNVFISECYELGSVLLKVDSEKAKVIWQDAAKNRREQSMRVHWSNPVLLGDYLYGCSGRNPPDSDFRCIEFSTGKVMWSDNRRTRAAVTAVGDHLLVLEERGRMEVMKATPKEMQVVAEWNFRESENGLPELSYPCWAAPIVVGDKVLIRGDQKVVCLELKTR